MKIYDFLETVAKCALILIGGLSILDRAIPELALYKFNELIIYISAKYLFPIWGIFIIINFITKN